MRGEGQVGTQEETPLLTQSECEPLSQSGCSLSLPAVRAWCLLPVKLGVSAAASARMVPVQDLFIFFHSFVWEPWELSHFPPVFSSNSLPRFLCLLVLSLTLLSASVSPRPIK